MAQFNQFILQGIDVIWLPIAWLVVHKSQRWMALGFVALSMVMMRMIADLMQEIGAPHGFMGLVKISVFDRGLVLYSLVYAGYLVFAHYTPSRDPWIFMAGSLSIFFAAAILYGMVMVL